MILKHLLNGRQFSSFILVQDNEFHSAHHLLRRIISDNLARRNTVHVFSHSAGAHYEEFISNGSFKLHISVADPWNLNGGSAVDPVEWISPRVDPFNVLVIDSLSYSLVTATLESICLRLRDLKAINYVNRRTQIVGVLNTNLTKPSSVEFQEINRLAESVITLSSLPLTQELRVEHRKYLGKRLDGNYTLTLSDTGNVDFCEKTKSSNIKDSKSEESTPQVVTTFKLSLNDEEKESRSQVVLPYLKNSSSQGGKIIYEPDANDDWDDEDPDDDLEI